MDDDKPSLDELMHHGVMGMKWGHHKAQPASSGSGSSGGSAPAPKSNRQLNKESRQRDNAARNAQIDAARQTFNSGAARDRYLKAKAQYQQDKKTLGTREARKRFNAVKDQNLRDYEVAQQAKSGAETVGKVLAIGGTVALSALLHHAAQNA